jgi:hypothetical protein
VTIQPTNMHLMELDMLLSHCVLVLSSVKDGGGGGGGGGLRRNLVVDRTLRSAQVSKETPYRGKTALVYRT